MNKILTCAAVLAAPAAAWAHPGHGLPGAAHWHATDVAGLALGGVVALLLALWLARDK